MVETTPFRPFDPNAVPATADLPVAEKPDKKPSRKRKPRQGSVSATGHQKPRIPAAPKHKRPTRKKTAKKTRKPRPIPSALAGALNRGEKVLQQRAKAVGIKLPKRHYGPRVQKVDLDTALSIGAMLKPSDLKAFGDIRQHLGALNKATRRRVLGAIQKVFG